MKKAILILGLILATTASVFAMTYDEAKTQSKPIVIMFHKHGCSACKTFSPVFDIFASNFSNKFNFVKENIQGSSIANSLDFDTVPAIFIIDPQTNKAKRISDDCAWDKGCFTDTLNSY